MWFFEMKYRNNRILGGHFYNRDEMYNWIMTHFKYYTYSDLFTSFRIWYKKEKEDDI